MKTVLVFRAADIFMRDIVTAKLEQNGICTFGADSSVNVIYPNTPNLYWSGASAVIDGYRILVKEEDEEQAKVLLNEMVKEFQQQFSENQLQLVSENSSEFTKLSQNDLRRFYLSVIISLFLPIVPPFFAIYFLVKAIRGGNQVTLLKGSVSLLIIAGNITYSYALISNAL